jgi:hypothetical protein
MSIDIDDAPVVARKEKKGKQRKTKLDDKHRELIEWIVSHAYGTWDEEAGRLDTHTAALAEAVEALGLTGDFKTIATGKGLPGDRNCFCYPKPGGVWLVVRHGKKGTVVKEADTWRQSQDGYTVCLLNKAEKKGDAIEAIVACHAAATASSISRMMPTWRWSVAGIPRYCWSNKTPFAACSVFW